MSSRSGLLANPLGQFAIGAFALVVGAALLFSLIGAVSGDAEQAATPRAADTPAETATASDPATDDAPQPTATDATEPTTDDAPTDTETATATEAPTEPAPTVEPASIRIQVLGGADLAVDQDAVVDCLRSAGYSNLITGNRARSTYEATTVFYTAGEDNQAAAQQVANTLGVASVEEQPGNLSEDVPVHVVAGNDGSDIC